MPHPVLSEGRVALVTGAASGIGRAACKRFASLGIKVCPADINEGEVTAEMDAKRMAWATGDIVSGKPPLSRWHDNYKKVFEEFTP